MHKYIALLRGINVSGQKKIKMAELKEILIQSGLQSVQTYIQSGNILFESLKSESEASAHIEVVIFKNYGFDVKVMVLKPSNMQRAIDQNPFVKQVDDTKKLYTCFMFDKPETERLQILADTDLKGDEYKIIDNIIYTCYHNGMGQSKMDISLLEKKLKVSATSRNWRTINKLVEM